MKTFLPVFLALLPGLLCFKNTAFSQINDNCEGAAEIFDVENFCSPFAAGNTFFATASPVPKPPCFTNANRDIWFFFTAVATDVSITINGSSATPGGTLGRPSVALYRGDCPGQLTLLGCEHDSQFDIAELVVGDLTPGETYYIRVDGSFPGSFQYCIRNFFSAGPPSGDCIESTVLCEKRPFSVPAITGPGIDPSELDGADCFAGLTGIETQVAWFVWTASTSGPLEFTLTPNNPNDDLDFVVYRLPNGPADCGNKIVERCMAAGDFFSNSPCMGPTGLSASATDISQPPGCAPGEDNFLAPLDMVAGETYALAVNNFTNSGSGFQIDWGVAGNADFQSPNAGFTDDNAGNPLCLGETIAFTDTTSFPGGNLTGWEWNFGKDAVPATAATQGPHTVQYASEGAKTVTLTVETALGCRVTVTRQIEVEFCCALEAAVAVSAGCAPEDNGAAATATLSDALAPFTYTWSNGQSDSTAANLASGNHTLIVEDANECADTVAFTVNPAVITYNGPKDTLILAGQPVTLIVGSSDQNIDVTWTSGNDTQNGPSIQVSPTDTTIYYIDAVSGDCIFSDSVIVAVQPERFIMPNAFTPNGDGDNDTFYPVASGVEIFEFSIWSRWGNLVYDDPSKGWDGNTNGSAAPTDIYVYRIAYRRLSGEEIVQKGDVALLR